MPVIKSAIKKLRQDKKRELQNDALRNSLKSAVRAAKKTKTGKAVTTAIKIIDKSAKNKIIHRNKAARLKSAVSKLARLDSSSARQAKPIAKSKKTVEKTKKTIITKKKASPKKAVK